MAAVCTEFMGVREVAAVCTEFLSVREVAAEGTEFISVREVAAYEARTLQAAGRGCRARLQGGMLGQAAGRGC